MKITIEAPRGQTVARKLSRRLLAAPGRPVKPPRPRGTVIAPPRNPAPGRTRGGR